MNLKEAFRYQNRLQRFMEDAQDILSREQNITKVENTALLHKVNPDASDETTVEPAASEYSQQITELSLFLMFLLRERETLTQAICQAKRGMALDFDGQIGLNNLRQSLAMTFRRMSQLRASENLYPGAGVGYKFNAEGNQVSYRCDLKKVVSINFDRNKVRSFAASLCKQADAVSAELDKSLVNTQVDYTAPFDVNESFADVFAWFVNN